MVAKLSLLLALVSIQLVSGAVLRRQGTQFITGLCKSDADCASGCCGFKSGKCAGAIIAQERDGGCGFGNATPNDDAARKLRGQAPAAPAGGAAPPAAPPANNGAGGAAAGSGKAPGTQFITGTCANDGECASGCCGFKSGKCAGAIIAQERDGGCGFGNATPNDDAARKLRGQARSLEVRQGTQFITGTCNGDADCASGCCGFKSGKCAGAIIAQERDGGCGFGNATPNDDAARKLRGQAPAAPAGGAAPPAAPPANNGAGGAAAGSGKAPGTQFITGTCANDGECASGCCGFKSGKCAGAIIAQERDGGCGFGNATPNDDAARKLRGQA
ncbi:hypothetical protein E1B28_012530 [Marasmius oreades]|uniref:Biotrophy-associated secreted protein 2 n=1 Tax=Marasmius oreades TaxID=181124 RepID=A0A9P7UNS9_9AGAR|nr:uncharacterized protein E1B28_012530 [Marasmius oreades]KAG7088548.1 hypothetical protein E1B28_012530 [Marasmius oreades]